MNRLTPALLPVLLAVACSTHEQAPVTLRETVTAPFECTPEFEGRFVGGSSGLLFNVPFRGSLRLRFADGREAPARFASIALADRPCPRGRPRPLPLDSQGRFEEKFSLVTDSQRFCEGGQLKTKDSLETLRLTLAVPGCGSVAVAFSGQLTVGTLEVRCPDNAAEYRAQPFRQPALTHTGAQVEFRGTQLYSRGTRIPVPTPVELLSRVLGATAALVPAAGDEYSNDVYEWEASGVYGYAKRGEKTLHALAFLLDAESNTRHWCAPGTVALSVNGFSIRRDSHVSQLRKAGFSAGTLGWEMRCGDIYAALEAIGEPLTFQELEVGVLVTAPNTSLHRTPAAAPPSPVSSKPLGTQS